MFGVRQPDISKMLRGEFRQFSVERLLRFLVALNQDVEIVVKTASWPKQCSCLACFVKRLVNECWEPLDGILPYSAKEVKT